MTLPAVRLVGAQTPSHDAQLIEELRQEIQSLRTELAQSRERDQTLRFYMQRVDEEMRLAARLQQDFLPKVLPQVGKVHFHALYRPAGYVSGDLYDVMRLDEQHVGFFMADAVGHGMPAALLTMFLKRSLITKQITGRGYRILPPGETMAHINEALVQQNLSQATFATALYGLIDTRTLQMRFASAGHPPPVLMRHRGELEQLEADGALLGIFPGEVFTEGAAQLGPQDRLLAYTDGLEVAFSEDRTQSTSRWREELEQRRRLGTQELLMDLAAKLDDEAGSLQPQDDLTMIVAEVE